MALPIKGLAPEPLLAAEVGPQGLAGDRAAALFVRDEGHARSGKTYRGKEERRLHLCASSGDAIALGAAEDVALETREDGPYFDDASVSLILDRWIDEGSRLCGRPLEPLRFRPNIYVRCAPLAQLPGVPAEANSSARCCASVAYTYASTDPIARCVTITYDSQTAEADPAIGRAIAQERANVMGVYCTVERTGPDRTGRRRSSWRRAIRAKRAETLRWPIPDRWKAACRSKR